MRTDSSIVVKTGTGFSISDFTVSASRTVTPDTLTASLSFIATASTLKAAQQQLNSAFKGLVATAKKGKGYKVATGGYYAGENYNRDETAAKTFSARQSITLTGTDAADAILAVVAELQEAGMALNGLNYSLSPKQAGSLNDELLTEAVGKADATAKSLAKAVGAKSVELIQITPMLPGDGAAPKGARSFAAAASLESAGGGFDAPTAEAAEATISVSLSVIYRLVKAD
ncbi:MAG: DUF541 domain-containing protein [Proteobacteria bacterium]|nr:DUF541 domain-containing protein [Pseudomonadota bacterium]